MTLIHKDYEEVVVKVSALSFYATDLTFKSLHGLDSWELVREFDDIAQQNGYRIGKTAENQATPMAAKKKFKHILSFREEVELLRNLHPEKDITRDSEMLDSANRRWRRGAEEALHMNLGTIGGLMKEAISVACLSRRCYRRAEAIMTSYQHWKLKRQTNDKVNRMLFVQLPGLRTEQTIFNLLCKFERGFFTKLEFNEKLKEAKIAEGGVNPIRKRHGTGPANDTGSLKRKNAALEEQNISLQRELTKLRKQLKPTKNTPNSASDVYTFVDSDEEVDSDQSERNVTLFEEDDDVHSPPQNEAVSMDASEGEGEGDLPDIIYYSDQEEDSLEGSLVVLTPKMTYSRYIGVSFSTNESENAETASVKENAQTASVKENAQTATDNEETLLTTLHELRKDNEEEPCQREQMQKEQMQNNKDNRKTKTSIEIKNLEEGKCVLAKDDGDWFKAKVVKMKEDGVKVHYIGYGAQFDKWLSLDEVKEYEFSIGEDVKARWEDGFFYKGKIVEKNAKVYTVLFNDGITGRTEDIKF